jgi:hypothetical protein
LPDIAVRKSSPLAFRRTASLPLAFSVRRTASLPLAFSVRRTASLPLAYGRQSIDREFLRKMDARVKPEHDR